MPITKSPPFVQPCWLVNSGEAVMPAIQTLPDRSSAMDLAVSVSLPPMKVAHPNPLPVELILATKTSVGGSPRGVVEGSTLPA